MPAPSQTDGVATYETTVRVPIRFPLPQLLKVTTTDAGIREFQEYVSQSPPNERLLVMIFRDAIVRDDTDHEVAKGQIRVHVQADSVPPATLAMLTRLLGTFRGSFLLLVEGTYTSASSITSVSVTAIVAAKLQPV